MKARTFDLPILLIRIKWCRVRRAKHTRTHTPIKPRVNKRRRRTINIDNVIRRTRETKTKLKYWDLVNVYVFRILLLLLKTRDTRFVLLIVRYRKGYGLEIKGANKYYNDIYGFIEHVVVDAKLWFRIIPSGVFANIISTVYLFYRCLFTYKRIMSCISEAGARRPFFRITFVLFKLSERKQQKTLNRGSDETNR